MLKSAVHSKESLLVALLLAMNTGFVDAFTFFHFDGRFASLQTGNLIQTGINLAHGNLEKAFQFIIPILFFALGALLRPYSPNIKPKIIKVKLNPFSSYK